MTAEEFARLDARLDDISRKLDDLKIVAAAEHEVVEAASRLRRASVEFHGDLTFCHEYLDRLWVAVDRLAKL